MMTMKIALAALATMGLLSSAGCRAPSTGTSASAPASAGTASAPDAVAAELQGVKVTVAELDEKLKGPLRQLSQQQYDLRRQMLQQTLTDMLLKREAAARGVSVDELVRTEVDKRVPAPTPAEIETLYSRVKGQVNGQPLQAVQPRLVDYLQKQARDRRSAEFRRELEKKHGAKVLLAPPRFEVSVAADAPSLGPEAAPITIVEYTDYQCPYCQRAQETVEAMLQRYGPKVRLV